MGSLPESTAIYPPICEGVHQLVLQHTDFMLAVYNSSGGNASLNASLQRLDNATLDGIPEASNRHAWFEVVTPVISFLGIVGNVFNLLVLTRRRMLSSMDRLEKSTHRERCRQRRCDSKLRPR